MVSARTAAGELSRSPTHRMKKTQYEVTESRHVGAVMLRAEADAAKEWADQQQKEFLKRQAEKVLKGHLQKVEKDILLKQ